MYPISQGDIAGFVFLAVFAGACAWIFYIAESTIRRRQQNAMQRHVLDKFSSAKDFADFIQSPAGQKYIASFSDAVTSPRNSILTSIKIGVVAVALSPAFIVSGMRYHIWFFDVLGLVSLCLGLGFLVSTAISYFLVKKGGLGEKEL